MRNKDWKRSARRLYPKLSLVLALVALSSPLMAGNNVAEFNILSSNFDGSRLEIRLSDDFEGIPKIESGQGIYRMTLYNTGSKKLELEELNGGVLQKARIVPSTMGAVLELEFYDLLATSGELVDYSIDKNLIEIAVKRPKLSAEIENAGTVSTQQEPLWKTLLWQVLVYLAVIVVCGYLFLKFYKKKIFIKSGRGKIKAKVIDIFHLSNRQKIWVVEMNNNQYALSVGPQSANLIAQLETPQKNLLKQLKNNPNYPLAKIKSILHQNVQKKAEWSKLKTAKSFKQELTTRIKQLKPLK